MNSTSFRDIQPTKSNLLNLQKRLDLAIKGQTFLELKRGYLLIQLKRNYKKYREVKRDFLNSYRNVFLMLNKSYKEMGKLNLNLISRISKIQYKPLALVSYKKTSGILLPKIEYKLKEGSLPAYSFDTSSHHLDELIAILKKSFEKMFLLAEMEELILKLGMNFKKVTNRINGLKNIIIPKLERDTKNIKEVLEEYQRENFIRVKKVKDILIKKQYQSIL